MKNKKAKKLMYYDIVVVKFEHARILDLLLTRYLGEDMYHTVKHKRKSEWRFKFWATPKEFKIIDQLFTEVITPDWDIEYELLIKETES